MRWALGQGSKVAIVVDHDAPGEQLEAALSLSKYLQRVMQATPVVMATSATRSRFVCRRAHVLWRSVPHPWMDGTFDSWLFFRSLAAKLRRVRPDFIVAIGPHAGVACALLWRTCGAAGYLWYQHGEGLSGGLDPRGLALARGRTRQFAARTPKAATTLASYVGLAEPPPGLIADRMGRPVWSRLVASLHADTDAIATFDVAVMMRSVFPRFVQLHERALATVRDVRQSGMRQVAIVGDGLRARAAIAAFRDRAIAVTHLVVSGSTELGPALDGVPRARLGVALADGARCVVLVGPTRVSPHAVARAARRAGIGVVVYGSCDCPSPPDIQESDGGPPLDRRVARAVSALCDTGTGPIQIYGASQVGRLLLRHARKRRLEVRAFVDGNRALWGEVVDGIEVVPLAHVTGGHNHRYVIGSVGSVDGIQAALRHAYRDTPIVPEVFTL